MKKKSTRETKTSDDHTAQNATKRHKIDMF